MITMKIYGQTIRYQSLARILFSITTFLDDYYVGLSREKRSVSSAIFDAERFVADRLDCP
jgi:hypothetical protein